MRMLVFANTGNICILNRAFITSNYKANLLYNRRCWLESGHTTRGFQPQFCKEHLSHLVG